MKFVYRVEQKRAGLVRRIRIVESLEDAKEPGVLHCQARRGMIGMPVFP